MLPLETLLQTARAVRTPVVQPQPVQPQPVQQQSQTPTVPAGSQVGDTGGEFVKAIFGSLTGQNQATPVQSPQNGPQRAPEGPALSVDLAALRPPEGNLRPADDVLLKYMLQILGVR